MIYEIKTNTLSKSQIRNLGKGKGVPVYAGNFPIEVDKNQYTRFHNNMRLGKAFTLKSTAKQGKGIFGDIFNFIKSKPLLKSAANAAIRGSKKYAHKGVDYLSKKAHKKRRFPSYWRWYATTTLKRRGKGLLGDLVEPLV